MPIGGCLANARLAIRNAQSVASTDPVATGLVSSDRRGETYAATFKPAPLDLFRDERRRRLVE
jgi:hypothetical protein